MAFYNNNNKNSHWSPSLYQTHDFTTAQQSQDEKDEETESQRIWKCAHGHKLITPGKAHAPKRRRLCFYIGRSWPSVPESEV